MARGQITELLERARAGDASASDELMARVQVQLHRIAQKHLNKERPGHTLQPTALVNEAYLGRLKPARRPATMEKEVRDGLAGV